MIERLSGIKKFIDKHPTLTWIAEITAFTVYFTTSGLGSPFPHQMGFHIDVYNPSFCDPNSAKESPGLRLQLATWGSPDENKMLFIEADKPLEPSKLVRKITIDSMRGKFTFTDTTKRLPASFNSYRPMRIPCE